MSLPTGTITFLFTDIEGSTRLWEEQPDAMRLSLARHDELVRAAIESNGGSVFKTIGDAFCAAFVTAPEGVRAALLAQQSLNPVNAQDGLLLPLRVRMALHTGSAELRNADYFGQSLNRVARLLAAGHGGQVLISNATYELVRDLLPENGSLVDLGEHRLKDLQRSEQVYQLKHHDLSTDFPPLRSLDYPDRHNNLPAQLTSFVGREMEMADVKGLLGKSRLLTLTGSGGTGKSRLSLQVAADVLEHYPDGVWFVELAAISHPDMVAQTVAQGLSIREAPGEPITKTLLAALKHRNMLLILDNCEHLLEASGLLVDALLKSCTKVKVLASSREVLGLAGESSYRVPSLSSPCPASKYEPSSITQYESVRLFVERAAAAKSDFTVTNDNAQALVSVCQRLDGIPLAIELAAARVRAMPVEDINDRLKQRFTLLTGGSRTALPRQQTLRALIDWSYDLLDERQKALLCRLSVFMGGWSVEAAEQVCADEKMATWEVLDLLTSLLDKSLALYDLVEGKARYRLLETVRQYARDRLVESGESGTVRKRHVDYYLAVAEKAESKLTGPEQGEWLQRLEVEHENLRASLEWSLNEDAGSAIGLRLCGALGRFWTVRGHLSEGRQWCVRALEKKRNPERDRERSKALNWAGRLSCSQGDYSAARIYYEESLEIGTEIGDRTSIGRALSNLGMVSTEQGDYTSARTFLEASMETGTEIGDLSGIANSLMYLGNVAHDLGDSAGARDYYEKSLAIKMETGDRDGIASSLNSLGNVAYSLGDSAVARDYYEKSLTITREIGNQAGIANLLNNLGIVAYGQDDYALARTSYQESLAIQREIGELQGTGGSLCNLGNVVFSQCDYASARAYYEESIEILREVGNRRFLANALEGLGNVNKIQGDYSSARAIYEESLAVRREIGARSGIALSLHNLGGVDIIQENYASARIYLQESLDMSREIGNKSLIACSIEAFASLAAKENKSVQAATLWGAGEALRERISSPMPPNEKEKYDQDLADLKQILGDDAFNSAWEAGRALTMEQAIELADAIHLYHA